jgi:hypothetical protein
LPARTESEVRFEEWCRQQQLRYRRIKEAYTAGNRRPDYAVAVPGGWCIVEIKEIEPNPADEQAARQLLAGKSAPAWVEPGARVRRRIKDAAGQLRKFSKRGLPTVALLVDKTVSFLTEDFHIITAMSGRQRLVFVVNQPIENAFLGIKPGGGATTTATENTSISAVAVLGQPSNGTLVIDLYHNPHARVPIAREAARQFVRRQLPSAEGDREESVLDMLQSGELQEWFEDPKGTLERKVREVLAELREKKRDT